jgi:hypothetical protein
MLTYRQDNPMSGEEGLQIRHPAMIYILVGFVQPPDPFGGVGRKIVGHILMHQYLQICSQNTIGSNHHIRTHADMFRHIAMGIWDYIIRSVVTHILPGAPDGSRYKIFLEGISKTIQGK